MTKYIVHCAFCKNFVLTFLLFINLFVGGLFHLISIVIVGFVFRFGQGYGQGFGQGQGH